MDEVLKQLGEVGELLQVRGDEEAAVQAEANATPIIRFVDLILYQAILDRASDIHFEPFENEFKIRYRVDGALYEMAPPPRHLALPVISRVKVMANMNIAERRLPQDGRIQKHIAGRNIDLRVSTLPTQFGESLVLRVLDRTTVVKAGEIGGVLELVLNRLAEFQEKAAKIKNKVAAAMVYPVIVITMAFTIMGFLLVFIVPKFEAVFHDLLGDKPLPAITMFVINMSRLVQAHWLVLIGVIVAIVFGYRFANRTKPGKSVVDRVKLHLPLFGDLNRKNAISRFSRTLGTLVTSGVPILQALNITRETAGNMVIARAISQVHDSVKEGESIVQPLEASRVFPPMVISMVDVGEETGKLPEMLLKIADVYDDEVDNAVAGITAALEPIMIVCLALIVGTIVIALFMPLIAIIQGLQQQT
jgi:hypothetical protein